MKTEFVEITIIEKISNSSREIENKIYVNPSSISYLKPEPISSREELRTRIFFTNGQEEESTIPYEELKKMIS